SDKPKEAPKFAFGGASTTSTITFGKPPASSTESNNTKPVSGGFDWAAAGMKKPTLAADEWKCSVCDAKNKNFDDKCVCCEEPNPNKKASYKPKEAPKFTFGGTSTTSTITFGKPPASSTESNDTKPVSGGFDWAAAGMKKPTLAADEWKCSVCDAKNKNTDDKCVCCEEPNPNKKTSDKPKEAPKFTFGGASTTSTITFGKPNTSTETKATTTAITFGKPANTTETKTTTKSNDTKPVSGGFDWAAAGMKKPTLAADEWKCSVCDAKNKSTDDKCVCCEEPNPNKKASDKPKEAPKFTFGSNTSSTSKPLVTFGNNTSSVTFGQNSDGSNTATSTFGFGKPFGSNTPSSTITFGNNNTTTSSTKPVAFSFNTTTSNGNTKTTTTGFSFGTSNTSTTTSTFGSSTTTFTTTTSSNKPFSSFSFGQPNNNANNGNN
ncbi:hypothetical protein PIROE2DRAFT_10839, partial [Piromyces sp. E2]